MVAEARKRTDVPVSIKIRILPDLRRTVDLVQQAESAGVEWIVVHVRMCCLHSVLCCCAVCECFCAFYLFLLRCAGTNTERATQRCAL